MEYGSINDSNPAPAHLLFIECVERISGWHHRRPEKNTPPTRASSRRGKRKEMREPDKEVTIYSPRCCIYAKVIPRNSLPRICSGRWVALRGRKREPTLRSMQPLETDAGGKVRKRRCFQLLTEELSFWIKKPPRRRCWRLF